MTEKYEKTTILNTVNAIAKKHGLGLFVKYESTETSCVEVLFYDTQTETIIVRFILILDDLDSSWFYMVELAVLSKMIEKKLYVRS